MRNGTDEGSRDIAAPERTSAPRWNPALQAGLLFFLLLAPLPTATNVPGVEDILLRGTVMHRVEVLDPKTDAGAHAPQLKMVWALTPEQAQAQKRIVLDQVDFAAVPARDRLPTMGSGGGMFTAVAWALVGMVVLFAMFRGQAVPFQALVPWRTPPAPRRPVRTALTRTAAFDRPAVSLPEIVPVSAFEEAPAVVTTPAPPSPEEHLLQQLRSDWRHLRQDPGFASTLRDLLDEGARRISPLVELRQLTAAVGGARVLVKQEHLAGPDDVLNLIVYGQVLLARYLGRRRVVTTTYNGRLGRAVAHAAAATGLKAVVCYDDHLDQDPRGQAVLREMERAGADLQPHFSTGPRLEQLAMMYALGDPSGTMYVAGQHGGAGPYNPIVAGFASVIGEEVLRQAHRVVGVEPRALVCHRRAGLASIGLLLPFLGRTGVTLECLDSGPKIFQREHAQLATYGRIGYSRVAADTVTQLREAFSSCNELDHLSDDNLAVLWRAISLASDLAPQDIVVAMLGRSAVRR